jgi:glycogenin glucosyltransferase
VFTKLRAWDLTDLDKVVLLDADTIVLRNIDDLFERPEFAAAPDFFLPDRFNSGVMVLKPSAAVFRAMLDRLASASSYDGGDQGFLNRFYPDWYAMPVANRLPIGYNVHHFVFQFLCAHEYLKQTVLHEIRVVHYTLQKPWMAMTLSGGASLWWDRFFGAHPEQDAAWKRRIHALEDWSFESVVAALGGE